MAPVKTIQTRTNYVPWLSDVTKNLQKERNEAQKKAADTGNPEDWRIFRSLRNRVTSSLRSDKKAWEQMKLNDKENKLNWECHTRRYKMSMD